ncbi:MAG: GreA/GreB family elongation factor [Deltaproteobacteria bacterium]|nr:GreA/GreB family elongation factor [Deltaproteobacteria bacterium]
MDKASLVEQLIARVREGAGVAEREMAAASEAARHGEDAKTRRDDTRMAIEYGALARAQQQRAQQAQLVLATLQTFRPAPARAGAAVGLGSLVEIEDEDGAGRTFFLAPAGAGVELTGPGGDGFFTVVTPQSPVGKATMGLQVGDTFDITVNGETRSWEITWIG